MERFCAYNYTYTNTYIHTYVAQHSSYSNTQTPGISYTICNLQISDKLLVFRVKHVSFGQVCIDQTKFNVCELSEISGCADKTAEKTLYSTEDSMPSQLNRAVQKCIPLNHGHLSVQDIQTSRLQL